MSSAFAQRRTIVAGVLLGVVLASLLIVRMSSAAFTASTERPASWATAQISLTADAPVGAAIFDADGMVPGSVETNCIAVTYGSGGADVDATVGLLGRQLAGDDILAQQLEVTVALGTGGEFEDCEGFDGTDVTADGMTLAAFAADHDVDDGDRIGPWAATDGATQVYRITVELPDDIDNPNALQGASVAYTFVWEARTTAG